MSYPPPGGYPPGGYLPPPPKHPQATTVLVLGILGVVLCQVLAPFAWIQGKKVHEEILASQGRISGDSEANIGKILGIVGTVILICTIALIVFFFGFAFFSAIVISSAA